MKIVNQESGFLLVLIVLCVTQSFKVFGLRQSLDRLERKLDAMSKYQGVTWPTRLSPEVGLMAQDPRQKIAAIKLHREQNPDLSLSEAKKDVEDFVSSKMLLASN